MLLALDTATQAVTVALADDTRVVAESTTVDALRHGELLAPAIADVLAQAGVQAVCADPDRGRRRARSLHRTARRSGDRPHDGRRARHPRRRASARSTSSRPQSSSTTAFLVATDARRKEVYWARYAASGARHTRADRGSTRRRRHRRAGRRSRRDACIPRHFRTRSPRSIRARPISPGLCLPGGAIELPPEPLYLRRPDVAEPGARKRVS